MLYFGPFQCENIFFQTFNFDSKMFIEIAQNIFMKQATQKNDQVYLNLIKLFFKIVLFCAFQLNKTSAMFAGAFNKFNFPSVCGFMKWFMGADLAEHDVVVLCRALQLQGVEGFFGGL